MAKAQYNMKLINILKDILHRLHDTGPSESIQEEFDRHFKDVNAVEILLIVQELKSGDYGITSQNVKELFRVYAQLYGHSMNEWNIPETQHPGHPVQIFANENKAFLEIFTEMNSLLELLEKNQHQLQEDTLERLKELMSSLGQFYNHYNRKEKLFFSILERYRHYTPSRIMWRDDDRIRNLYKGTKKMMERIPDIEFKYLKKTYHLFERQFKEMIFEEESFLLPMLALTFQEDDWLAIAKESDAYGYCFGEPEEKWVSQRTSFIDEEDETDTINHAKDADIPSLPFGGGYLTTHEANHILNHLPLEITFVDKNGLFKYFNERIDSSEMMLVRTPSSIGRFVANCHPPNSLEKVMNLIHDLQSKKRSSESMWFKKGGRYVYITYKGVFDENGEYLGILEYVQDIQPFLDLTREVKKELSQLDESF
ncbi:DUF438 domain-containing protein [Virgibacillus sp. NKC19-3]|uniref:DUF438 domain-containing protein n=1 Tax=Virgibacillus saliphilus TaxID=2831674 RepID=UPI001C9A78D9|nr:DUF438 domain-containing protein [Virgibacillus sp. NKC19-3]MBY7143105.1 DUF438 domain-containing protein [Virgibacillus sp. NKC19-3]